MKRALITGITGQDGSYLAEFLLKKDYNVCGLVRNVSEITSNLSNVAEKLTLIKGDLTNQRSLNDAIELFQPDEVYNLAAQVISSWKYPESVGNVTGLGVTRMLEAVRYGMEKLNKNIKFFQASSSEIFANSKETLQDETTPFQPISPYGIAKTYGHLMTVNYREHHGLYAVNGILFNHESPRRTIDFVTKKITDGVARIHNGLSNKLLLGNLEAKRDWGFAEDYVEAMWMMLQNKTPKDYIIATGEIHSVKEFVQLAFEHVGFDYIKYVEQDPRFMRTADLNHLCGNALKIRQELGWKAKMNFKDLVAMMVDCDIEKVKK